MNNNTNTTNPGHPCDTTTGFTTTSTTGNIKTSNTNTSTTGGGNVRACARAREAISEQDLEALDSAYFESFRRSAPETIVALWTRYHAAGMETALLLMAISETMLAPYPSPRYMVAILRRWMSDGVMTETQRAAEQERREAWITRQHRRRDEERYGYRETAWGATISSRTGEVVDE